MLIWRFYLVGADKLEDKRFYECMDLFRKDSGLGLFLLAKFTEANWSLKIDSKFSAIYYQYPSTN